MALHNDLNIVQPNGSLVRHVSTGEVDMGTNWQIHWKILKARGLHQWFTAWALLQPSVQYVLYMNFKCSVYFLRMFFVKLNFYLC